MRISLRRILREPLLQFLAAGFAIFAVAQFLSDDRQRDARTIVIDDTLVRYLATLHSAQFGDEPDTAMRERLIADHVREEVLYREALARGLDRDDEIVRRRLAQKLEYLLAGNAELATPTDTELRAWYDSHIAQYTQPGGVTFEHRYFSSDRSGAVDRAAAALAAGASAMEKISGDPFPLANHYENLTRHDARLLFGDNDFVRHLFSTAIGDWSGPVASGYGMHLVRVTARTPDAPLPFAEVEASVREAWSQAARERAVERAVQDLVAQHQIERRDLKP